MKNMKKFVAVVAVLSVFLAASAVYAAAAITPAEIASGLTGKTIEEVNAQRASGKTYGTIASEAGKLDEFKTQMLEQKKAILDQRVKEGKLTQAQADEIYNTIKNNQAFCNGVRSDEVGKKFGAGFGRGNGMGMRQGGCGGAGLGNGNGFGACRGLTVDQ